MHSHAGAWERENTSLSPCSHAPAWEQETVSAMYAFPRRSVGTRIRFASPCSHAPAWEQETVSVMYAFPRRSVGTKNTSKVLISCNINHSGPVEPLWCCCGLCPCCAFSPSRGERFASPLFPCPRVGTRNGQRNVCIPTQERGNEKKLLQYQITLALLSPLWRCCGLCPCCAFSLSRGESFASPCSHAPRVGTRNGQRNVCIPTQERGNEKRF